MRRFLTLKTFLIAFGALIGLALAGAALFIAFFPKDLAIAEMERQVERATQRDLRIDGEVDLSFWPALGFSATQVSLSNAEGFGDKPFLAADRMVFAVAVMPLLRGDIQVKSLILEGADLDLQAQRDGDVNWAFPTEETPQSQTTIEDLQLDDVRLSGSRITFTGAQGAPLVIENADASFAMESLDAPSALQGAFDYRGQRLRFDADIASPRAILEKGVTDIDARVRSAPIDASIVGAFNVATGAIEGRVEAVGGNLRDLLAWIGSPMGQGGGFERFSAMAALSHEGVTTRLRESVFRLDDIEATGDLTLTSLADGRIAVSGAVTSPRVDLNTYLPAPAQGAASAGGVEVDSAWSNAPLDLSGLRSLDADLTLNVGELIFQRMNFTDVEMALGVNGGAADARLTRISLYGGSGTARLIADGRTATPRIALELNAENVNALPLLTDAVGYDGIEGRGRLTASLAGQGGTQAALMRSLRGRTSFTFNDGALKGVNLAQVARSINAALSGTAVGEAAQTDFAEMGASFAVVDGVAVTEDVRLLNPFVRLEGAGAIDVGAQTIDMRIVPRAVRTAEGQGGAADVEGLGIPFRVTGSWARPSFRPSVEEVVRDQLREQAQRALEQRDPNDPLSMLGAAIFGRREQPAAPAEAAPEADAPVEEAPADESAEPEAEAPTAETPAEPDRPLSVIERLLRGQN